MDPGLLVHVIEVLGTALALLAWAHLSYKHKVLDQKHAMLVVEVERIRQAAHPSGRDFQEVRDNVVKIMATLEVVNSTVKRWDDTFFHNGDKGRPRGTR